MTAPYEQGGKWVMPKDPDDEHYYYWDIAEDLADAGMVYQSVTQIAVGVSVLIPAAITVGGTVVEVKLAGLSTTASPLNYCTITVLAVDPMNPSRTEKFDRTIWFVKEDH